MKQKKLHLIKLAVIIAAAYQSNAFAVAITPAPTPSTGNMVVDINSSTGSSKIYGTGGAVFGQGNNCYGDNCLINGMNSSVGGPANYTDNGFVFGNNASNTGVNGGAIGNNTVNNLDNNISIGGRTISIGDAVTSNQAVSLGQVQSLIGPPGITRPQVQTIADTAQTNAVTQSNRQMQYHSLKLTQTA
jgi:hypothetical protein